MTLNSTLILWPVMLLLFIPFWVLMLNGKRKAQDRRSGAHDPAASAIDNKAWSIPVVLTSNALANQFQLPIVFYALAAILIFLDAVSLTLLVLSWVYVLLRWFHAYVHVTSNHIPARFGSFVVSTVVLLIIFIGTVIALINASL